MKKAVVIFLSHWFLLFLQEGQSQSLCTNLITNGGFETMYGCPGLYNGNGCEIGDTVGSGFSGNGQTPPWVQLTYGSVDTWSTCYATAEMAAHPPYAGDAFLGLGLYSPAMGEQCEYFGQQLSAPLEAGKTYCLKFYARTNVLHNDFAADDIEVVFTHSQIVSPSPDPNFFGLLTGYVPDFTFSFTADASAGWGMWGWGPWEEATFLYTAAGGEQWISFGQFAPIGFGVTTADTYVHMDEISLVETSTFSTQVQASGCSACDGVAWTNATGNFSWYDAAGNLIASDTSQVSGLCPGNYTVILNCSSCMNPSQTFTIVENDESLSILPSTDAGCAPLCISIGFSSSSTVPVQSLSWDLGNGTTGSSSSTTTCYPVAGEYYIAATLTDTNGCTSLASDTIRVYSSPVADFYFAPAEIININADAYVAFYDNSSNATVSSWHWDFYSNHLHTSSEQNPQFQYDEAGNFLVTLIVETEHGCKDTVSKAIGLEDGMALFVPNAFTPNGDGVNDIFEAKGYGIRLFHMSVYNRWGELVYETQKLGEGWDGNVAGRMAQDDIYVWRVRYLGKGPNVYEQTGPVVLLK